MIGIVIPQPYCPRSSSGGKRPYPKYARRGNGATPAPEMRKNK